MTAGRAWVAQGRFSPFPFPAVTSLSRLSVISPEYLCVCALKCLCEGVGE